MWHYTTYLRLSIYSIEQLAFYVVDVYANTADGQIFVYLISMDIEYLIFNF